MRQIPARLIRLVLLTLLLASCASQRVETTPEPSQPPPTPSLIPRGGDMTIRLERDVESLRPWAPSSGGEEQLLGLIYRGLTRLNQRLEPVPDLATSWQPDQLGRTLTMTLRSDATWHDGQPLTSADVVWTLDFLRAITTTSALIEDLQRVVRDVQAPAPGTVVFALNEPYAPLLSELSLPILPRHRLEGRTREQLAALNFWEEPTGSGPFKLESRTPGESILLTPHAGFYGGEPYLDHVAFVVAPDARVVERALDDEDLLVAELPWETYQKVAARQQRKISLGSYVENGYYFMAFNLREGRLFADPRLREALALALDLPDVIEQSTGGQGVALGSDLLPGLWPGDGPAPASYNSERARQLLEEAGWTLPEGQTVRVSGSISLTAQLLVSAEDQRRIAVAGRIAEAASAIGMQLVVTPADFETALLSKLTPPFDFDLLLMSWVNSRVDPRRPSYNAFDPDNFPLFHSSQIYQGAADIRQGLRNFVAFRNQSFDNQVTAGRSLYDLEQRKLIYPELGSILAQQRPYLFLWADRQGLAINSRLKSAEGPINLNTPRYLEGIEKWYLEQ